MSKFETPLWERQEKETSKQYAYFCVYRDLKNRQNPLSKRSIALTAEITGKTEGYLESISRERNWVKRALAWDDEQDRIAIELARKEMEEEIRKMRKRQAEAGKFAQIKAVKALNKIPDEEIKPSDAARLLEVGSKLERTARGDVGEVIEERQAAEGAAISPVQFYMPGNGRDEEPDADTEGDTE